MVLDALCAWRCSNGGSGACWWVHFEDLELEGCQLHALAAAAAVTWLLAYS